MTTVGQRVRQVRTSKKMSLAGMASVTGIDKSHLSKIENDRMMPTLPTLFAIADALDVAPSTLMKGIAR